MAKKWFLAANKKQTDGNRMEAPQRINASDGINTSASLETLPHVLFADDDANMREYVSCLLKTQYRVTVVQNGIMALELAKTTRPDLILSDIIMPGMDGIQLLQALRQDPRTHDIPLILLSIRASEASKIDSFDAGADDYLVKPFTPPELLARIKAHITLKRTRNQAYQAIKSSEELLQSVFNGVPSSIAVYKTCYAADNSIDDFEMFLLNDLMCQSLNRPKHDIIGKRYRELFPTASKLDVLDLFKEVVYTGQSTSFERWYETNGKNRCLRFKANKLHDLLIVIADDMTAEKQLQIKNEQMKAKQLEMEAQQQREIFHVTLRTQEEERRRISENLHNGLGQMLFSIKLNLDTIDLSDSLFSTEENRKKLKNAELLLANCIRESRRISHELMPSILEDFGLEAAIENICSQLTGPCNFVAEIEPIVPPADQEIQLAVYRIIQELALNIVKHSQATEASIKIYDSNEGFINATVSDNGIGFDIQKEDNNATGLLTIKHRVKMLRGNIHCSSQIGIGTAIKISLPKTIDTY